MTEVGPGAISTEELFAGKKVVLISVPGAFTPTCSASHLPGFLQNADAVRAKGVDTIAFMAVNDIHVMNAWGNDQGVGDQIAMLADGNGEYAEALGIDYDGNPFGMGVRGRRSAFVVENGIATHVAIEAPGQFEVSKAEAVLAAI
jgi:peroxiredoxin